MSNITSEDIFRKNRKEMFGVEESHYTPYYGILSDRMIEMLCTKDLEKPEDAMITPYVNESVKLVDGKKVISYGPSSYGYDIRVGNEFKIFSNANHTLVDPKNIDDKMFVTIDAEKEGKEYVIIPPNSYLLCHSLDRFNLPRDITGLAFGKSTYARAAIGPNVTPLEAGWEGFLTIEIANYSTLPSKIYVGEGICQIVFHKGHPCRTSYADRGGKYNGQEKKVVTAKV